MIGSGAYCFNSCDIIIKQGWTGIRSKRNEFLERIPFRGIGIGTQFLFEIWNDFEERIPFLGIL